MTVIRGGSKILHTEKGGDDGWYFVASRSGVNVTYDDAPRSASVCIPYAVWDEIVKATVARTEAPPKRRRRRKAPVQIK